MTKSKVTFWLSKLSFLVVHGRFRDKKLKIAIKYKTQITLTRIFFQAVFWIVREIRIYVNPKLC